MDKKYYLYGTTPVDWNTYQLLLNVLIEKRLIAKNGVAQPIYQALENALLNLIPENIREGVIIGEVQGTCKTYNDYVDETIALTISQLFMEDY